MRSFFITKTDLGDVRYLLKGMKGTPFVFHNIRDFVIRSFYGLELPYCFENVSLIGFQGMLKVLFQ